MFVFVSSSYQKLKLSFPSSGSWNVPVNLAFQTDKSQEKEIKNSLQQKGIPVKIKLSHEPSNPVPCWRGPAGPLTAPVDHP